MSAGDSRNWVCPVCGGTIIGDGFTSVYHCENADSEDTECVEPDASVVLCRFGDDSEDPKKKKIL